MHAKVIRRQTILFLCTGNYYRSRFAELYFNYMTDQNDLPFRAFSRGFEVFAGRNTGLLSRHTQAYLKDLGVPLPQSLKSPIQLIDPDFDDADTVIALDRAEHRAMLNHYFPHRLKQVQFWEYPDMPFAPPDQVLPAIRKSVEQMISERALLLV